MKCENEKNKHEHCLECRNLQKVNKVVACCCSGKYDCCGEMEKKGEVGGGEVLITETNVHYEKPTTIYQCANRIWFKKTY
jgi:hypothetical protein